MSDDKVERLRFEVSTLLEGIDWIAPRPWRSQPADEDGPALIFDDHDHETEVEECACELDPDAYVADLVARVNAVNRDSPSPLRERYPERCEPVELEYGTGHSLAEDGPIKCRRAMASEVASETGGADLDSYVERLDEGMQSGAIGHAWGDYESALVVKRPGADEAFAAWCDRWLEVKAHVNEGDDR